ncbi:hypothetical protein COCCU_01160 [Corynebacterium occultum]|uniref:Uncharacterized protein n=1 Tax=Corynebacterium occultum TaxID=2675219 RepID=A0A6B8W8A9_9CORY|nr:hypothetical protein [Corynebacterium occultum]QGU06200.1 hypothetical protein COCCU_01160 [Corynebacterium occultum]
MSPESTPDNVVSLASVRARGKGVPPPEREPRTVILQVSNVQADQEVHRHIGIKDSLHLVDLHEALDISFSLDPGNPSEGGPWWFTRGGQRVDPAVEINHHLRYSGDEITYHWGLWELRLRTLESYPRDRGTPEVLCVGGSGSFADGEFDLAAVNAALTGTEKIRSVLASTHAEIRELIRRSSIFDFVPLLQALDLRRASPLPEEVVAVCRALPLEDEQVSRDAFWVVVLALSCMSDEHLAAEVLEATMASLGWVDDDGSALSGRQIRGLCAASLMELAKIGAYGEDALAPVDRLDIYRELLGS